VGSEQDTTIRITKLLATNCDLSKTRIFVTRFLLIKQELCTSTGGRMAFRRQEVEELEVLLNTVPSCLMIKLLMPSQDLSSKKQKL